MSLGAHRPVLNRAQGGSRPYSPVPVASHTSEEKTSPGLRPPPPGGWQAWALEQVVISMRTLTARLAEVTYEMRRGAAGRGVGDDIPARLRSLGNELHAAAAVLEGRRDGNGSDPVR